MRILVSTLRKTSTEIFSVLKYLSKIVDDPPKPFWRLVQCIVYLKKLRFFWSK
jgi:hypothetical protein